MNPLKRSSLLPSMFIFLSLLFPAISATIHEQFSQCLTVESSDNSNIFDVIFTQANSSYTSILESRIQNLRFNTTGTPKPVFIVTPVDVSQVQATIICSRRHNLQIRIRSGGHDYEGLSFVSPFPFVMLDLINFRNITVDVEGRVAWVQAAATLGELYYRIGEKSKTLAFPGGLCPTVGVGGHFSGGGYGYLLRKYGLAADNVVDAVLVDVNGRVLDRASMGEDLFWAIRGSGGNSFGVVISWKVNLVPVPPTVTYCRVAKTLEQNGTQILNRWQYVANKLPDDITIIPLFNGDATKSFSFDLLYLGRFVSLLSLMEERFPELGLKREDCSEVSWIESILPLYPAPSSTSLDGLLTKNNTLRANVKFKSDFVTEPIPETALEGLVAWFLDEENKDSSFYMVPYGGKMDEIEETSIPFPHRAGNLYKLAYSGSWNEEGTEAAKKNINWLRKVYSYMAPYVSKNPRQAYVNYRDLDIGTNDPSGITSYERASIWGSKYFKSNFDRLVRVKTEADPSDFFRNEQSVPPLNELATLIEKNPSYVVECEAAH